MRTLRPPLAAVLFAAFLAGAFGAAPAPIRAANFPSTHSLYHTYAEMVADIRAVEAAHPSIVKLVSIGQSYQHRTIWAAKVSDNVQVDENEPEVLIDGLHHAREHLSVEMTLAVLHDLANGYATNATIRHMVDGREIWIIFMVNPDGAEYDLTGNPARPFRGWRKNCQPIPGSTAIGVDLNRNYGYRWGCCGGSSRTPSSITYRGPSAFSAPETRVVRDFVNSRVVNGRQQIRTAITFHSQGELVLWPYGYTRLDVPSDMTRDDQRGLATLGRAMAATNRYTPEQSSDLYITDGDEIDWLYGVHRIFVYTFELYPTDKLVQGLARFYPPNSVVGRETRRNLPAVRMLIQAASCPYSRAGVAVRVRDCGAMYDDFEAARGWTVNPDATDTATGGPWQRRTSVQTSTAAGIKQSHALLSGARALVTGGAAGANANANDVDTGVTTVLSPQVTLPAGTGQRITFGYVFAHDRRSTADDYLTVTVEGEGHSLRVLNVRGAASERNAAWATRSVSLNAFVGEKVRIRITAADGAGDSLVEAMVDDVRITQPVP